MHILCLGLNHKTAQIGLRERLAFSDDTARAALARLGCGGLQAVAEMVILSTCNRTEIYVVTTLPHFSGLVDFLSETRQAPRSEIEAHVYRLKDAEAANHLFEVAAGLDSLVIGEPQILGQITHALELARGQNAAGPVLNRLFQNAIHAGKRARTETAISQNPASVSSLAAALAEQAVACLAEARVVLLGAGEMAELAVEALRLRGARRICVVNRTLERAHTVADRWGAEVNTFENFSAELVHADIVVASTGAPHILVSPSMVEGAMRRRPDRPMLLIDIALPRDIDPEAGNLPNVSLHDIDGLNIHLEQSLAERQSQVPQVRAILQQELETFGGYLQSLEMLPLIVDLRRQAEAIRRSELEKTLRRMPDLTEAERARIDALTQALMKKLLETPTNRLREEAACIHAPEYAMVARTLFGLQNSGGLCSFAGHNCPAAGPAAD